MRSEVYRDVDMTDVMDSLLSKEQHRISFKLSLSTLLCHVSFVGRKWRICQSCRNAHRQPSPRLALTKNHTRRSNQRRSCIFICGKESFQLWECLQIIRVAHRYAY